MTSRELEVYIIDYIKLHTTLKPQVLLYRDLNMLNGELKIPRIMTRTIESKAIRGYEEESFDEKDKIIKQVNVIRNVVSINFTGIKQDEVSKIRNSFYHKRGLSYHSRKKALNLVIEDITGLRDISDNRTAGQLEAWQFDLVFRFTQEHIERVPLIKKVDFELNLN